MPRLEDIHGSESFRRRNPHLYETLTDAQLPDAEPERDDAPTLGEAVSGKDESLQRTRVCITGFRVRPLDSDNFSASVKNLVDGLRHAHIITNDDPASIILETGQVRVRRFKEEKTIIFIDDGKP